jgi:hypothetical protein
MQIRTCFANLGPALQQEATAAQTEIVKIVVILSGTPVLAVYLGCLERAFRESGTLLFPVFEHTLASRLVADSHLSKVVWFEPEQQLSSSSAQKLDSAPRTN